MLLLESDEMKSRYVANTFLQSANESFFKPRGLVATIITYDPRAKPGVEKKSLDLSKVFGKKFRKSEKTETSADLPETAPLVFQEVHLDQNGNFFKKVGGFLVDFRDRRGEPHLRTVTHPHAC